MRLIITILLFFISANIFSQYVAHWTSTGQRLDSVQQSIDSIHFSTIAIVNGGVDSCKVPGPTYYYQVKSGSVISNKVLVYNTLSIVPDSIRSRPKFKKMNLKIIVGNQIELIIESNQIQKVECVLTDVVGRTISAHPLNLIKGVNTFSEEKQIPGVYIIQLIGYFDKITQKFIVP